MNRFVILAAALTVMFLSFSGCEKGSESIAPPQWVPPSVKPEPAVELQPVETAQAQTKAEPNVQATTASEPNVQQPAAAKPLSAPAQPAEINAAAQAPAASVQTSADELCNKCTEFLSKFVDKDGFVDYKTLSRKKLELLTVLDRFRTLDRNVYNSWSQDNKIAFWINAYNLEFIKIILDNYPIESTRMLRLFWPPNSIRHIKGIWNEHKFIIMNEEFTLQAIEQKFFKSEFGEPRVFFAIYYGTLSGPPLRNEAYCGKNLSTQLDDQAKKFLARGEALKIERENRMVYLSSILKPTWYGQYFVARYGTDLKFKQQDPEVRAVLNYLAKYIPSSDVDYLETGNYTVDYMRYDWTLNERGGQ